MRKALCSMEKLKKKPVTAKATGLNGPSGET